MKELGKGILTAARLGVIGYCSYKVIQAANERRKERKAEKEELMITDEVKTKVDKKEVAKVAVTGAVTGAVVALTVVQFDTVKKMQKDVETMKNIINDLQ